VTQHAATFVTMDVDGHTLNYSTADGTVRKWFEVAIEEVAVAPLTPDLEMVANYGHSFRDLPMRDQIEVVAY